MTKTEKLLNAFKNGDELTVAQIRARYGLENPSSAVDSLRRMGYAVYCNSTTNYRGEAVNRYRLGAPSREMVKLAHAAGYFGA